MASGKPDRKINQALRHLRQRQVAQGDGVRQTGDGWQLTGTLTVRNESRPVALDVSQVAGADGTLSARATCRIDRYEFGIEAMRGMAARYLTMSIEINAVRG